MGIEKYRILLDLPSANPALGFAQTASALRDTIQESEPQFAVAVFGGWGSGKTTLMRSIEAQLDQNRAIPVQFSAWRYEKEPHLIVPLLDCVREALVKWADDNSTLQSSVKEGAIKTASTIGKAIYSLLAGISVKVGIPEAIEVSFKANEALEQARRQDDQDRAARIPRSFYHATFRALADCFVKFVGPASDRRIVVFVDDLDRCLPNSALEVLESMKLFFDLPGFVFVVGLDRNVVEQSIDLKYGREQSLSRFAVQPATTTDSALQLAADPNSVPGLAVFTNNRASASQIRGADYIKKIFQLPFTLAPVAIRQLEEFLQAMLTDAKLSDDQEQLIRNTVQPHLRYVITETGVNPREIKRYINAFTLALKVKPYLNPDVVLTLQTIAFRPDWETVQNALLAYRDLFTGALQNQLGGEANALRNLDPKLAVSEVFLTYISEGEPGAQLLTLPPGALDEYIYSGEAVQSSTYGHTLLDLIHSVAKMRESVAQLRSMPNESLERETTRSSLISSVFSVKSFLASLTLFPVRAASQSQAALEAWLTTPPTAQDAVVSWADEADRLVGRLLTNLMDLYQSGSLARPTPA